MTSSSKTDFDPSRAEAWRARVGSLLFGAVDGRGVRVAIACARFNGGVTLRLLESALEALGDVGVERDDLTVAWVPGAFELPIAARALATGPRRADAVIVLGAVIRGETGHYDVVAGECASGVQSVQLDTGVPVVFGVLTTDTVEQALDRSRPDATNKGRETALSAVEMVSVLRQIAAR
ncbi:MAG: 6,7-dimethyl-8-ribityllumazine synthase [Acidimicrobiales bacterium]